MPLNGVGNEEKEAETFNFLGFTHICGKNHETGYFQVYRKTIGKRMAAKLKQIRQKLREKTKDIGKWLGSVVRGSFRYHAVPRNEERLKAFRHEVLRMWMWQLRRRSQRNRWSWERFQERLGPLIPKVEIQHPYPEVRSAGRIYPKGPQRLPPNAGDRGNRAPIRPDYTSAAPP